MIFIWPSHYFCTGHNHFCVYRFFLVYINMCFSLLHFHIISYSWPRGTNQRGCKRGVINDQIDTTSTNRPSPSFINTSIILTLVLTRVSTHSPNTQSSNIKITCVICVWVTMTIIRRQITNQWPRIENV